MLKRVLDLLIAVTFVYAAESIFNMFNNNAGDNIIHLKFYLSGSLDEAMLFGYFLPAVAIIVHIAQVAHYHQKRRTWGIEDKISKEVEGIWEFFQITFIMIPVVSLILIAKFIPLIKNREYIIYLWAAIYLSYVFGDYITRRSLKNATVEKEFQDAVKVVFECDLFMAILLTLYLISVKIYEKILSRADCAVSILSVVIILINILISIKCHKFLFKDKE